MRTRVVRSSVWQLQADAVSYRTALAFDAAVDTEVDGYPLPIETPVIEGVRAVPTRATDVRALCDREVHASWRIWRTRSSGIEFGC